MNSYILVIIIFLSCTNANRDFVGNWAVYKMRYNGRDISRIDSSSTIYVTNSMIVDKNNITLIINTRPEVFISASYRYFVKDGIEFIEISNSDDERYNGKYILEIDKVKTKYTQEHILKLKSKSMYIEGLRNVSSLP